MNFTAQHHMHAYELIKKAAESKAVLTGLTETETCNLLHHTAETLRKEYKSILEANSKDLQRMDSSDPKYDRLQLTKQRIEAIAHDMEHIAKLHTPNGQITNTTIHPNGMTIRKIRVPFGVIGIIYEARPNVTADVYALCLKSGNVCILKGGKEAENTNKKITEIIHSVLSSRQIDPAVCTLLPSNREATALLLGSVKEVDLIIPRGSSTLINYVRQHSRVPVIETGAGICHTYFDATGDLHKGTAIICNAKTRRVSVCNALDCLIIHRQRLADLSALCQSLAQKEVIIYADYDAYDALKENYPDRLLKYANEEHYGIEFLDYKMSIRTVNNIDEAIEHIGKYSSRHSECIISEDIEAIRQFQQKVDAACVYANVSTAFTDGAQFGFGAEIGISTQKLHARGPMALAELTTYKYIIDGNGQVRHP